ncbi:MAG: UDP-N-acetylmuramoyl-L-alanine--D-glutamate ligase [Clostridia bacterium]|nr:UDP-N-acetylmuramoyl-L-alanine--D-glutamate ligase [Clostridia bacterium]
MEELINKLTDKKIVILGYGREGKSTYRFIRKYLPYASLLIIDANINVESEENLNLLNDMNLEVWKTNDYLDMLQDYDVIFKSPGISFKGKDISKIKSKITSQLEVLLKYINVYSIGVTGTKGKSTTSTLIYTILKNQGKKVCLCGNIGIPPFDEIDEILNSEYVVIEMSSHQLEYMDVSPNIAILLNIFEEHLDHYNSYDDYALAKVNIALYQKEGDYFIYNKDNSKSVEMIEGKNIKSKMISISASNKVTFNFEAERKLLGKHNEYNIMFALATSEILKLDSELTSKTILEFEGLPHRMEYVGEIDGVKYYNDSISTIPEAAMRAIETFKETNTILLGGMDRGVHYRRVS